MVRKLFIHSSLLTSCNIVEQITTSAKPRCNFRHAGIASKHGEVEVRTRDYDTISIVSVVSVSVSVVSIPIPILFVATIFRYRRRYHFYQKVDTDTFFGGPIPIPKIR